jgi:hypothetical protein
MTGESDLRRIEDIDGAALTYSEVKAIASGNPLVIEKASIDAEVGRLTRLQGQHRETQFKVRSHLRHLSEDQPRLEKRLEAVRADVSIRQDTSGNRFVIILDGQELHDRGIAGELILRRAMRVRGTGVEHEIGCFAGFRLIVADSYGRGPEILLRGTGLHTAKVTDTALGTIRSVEHAIQSLDEVASDAAKSIVDARKRATDLVVQLDQPFEYAERLASLARRQQEIADALDLTKNQASGQLEADTPSELASSQEESDSLKEDYDEEWL